MADENLQPGAPDFESAKEWDATPGVVEPVSEVGKKLAVFMVSTKKSCVR